MENLGSAAIALCNPKSPSNVGAVMRAAGCYGASAIFYNGTRFERAAKYHTDTRDAHLKVPLTPVESFVGLAKAPQKMVCIELAEGATPLPDFVHPEHALYVFGPEDSSIDQATINAADAVVYIPTTGCMNLAATVNVLLYDRMAKQNRDIDPNLIKQSRDVNNRLVFNKP
ncbi:RNA methyltransferase [Amphritea sp. 2_MG-2023]|uniref:RNA methyltransferase n=1 Tax=Amphritea TaxID=515417 RepID=UPI001C074898|nr:RNA methyltransferase [Amphritea sp. 2_MG-2023]MBU2964246.1 RNA methyltransferase [Amphritea atlantica]MDO6419497.1 RNA methyltransferase [Amphritea sp. 2_MG-2023]MDX2422388.1 RNA methyltransferase [Amphritea sp.]